MIFPVTHGSDYCQRGTNNNGYDNHPEFPCLFLSAHYRPSMLSAIDLTPAYAAFAIVTDYAQEVLSIALYDAFTSLPE